MISARHPFLCHPLLPSPTHHVPAPGANICFSRPKPPCQSTPDPFQTLSPPQSHREEHPGLCEQHSLLPSGHLHPFPQPPTDPSPEQLKSDKEAPAQLQTQFHLSLKTGFCWEYVYLAQWERCCICVCPKLQFLLHKWLYCSRVLFLPPQRRQTDTRFLRMPHPTRFRKAVTSKDTPLFSPVFSAYTYPHRERTGTKHLRFQITDTNVLNSNALMSHKYSQIPLL